MAYRNTHESLRSLYALASTQGGYFTAKQAAEVGYRYPHLVYHLRAGNFERAGHGLYRLATIPPSEHDDLIRISLWSRDRQDLPQAVVSHESALFLHQLSDVLPHRIHLTVPPLFRKLPPRGCKLHKARLGPQDVEQREGFAVTAPLRTLMDIANDAHVPEEQLTKAVTDAVRRGLVRSSTIKDAAKRSGGASNFSRTAALAQ